MGKINKHKSSDKKNEIGRAKTDEYIAPPKKGRPKKEKPKNNIIFIREDNEVVENQEVNTVEKKVFRPSKKEIARPHIINKKPIATDIDSLASHTDAILYKNLINNKDKLIELIDGGVAKNNKEIKKVIKEQADAAKKITSRVKDKKKTSTRTNKELNNFNLILNRLTPQEKEEYFRDELNQLSPELKLYIDSYKEEIEKEKKKTERAEKALRYEIRDTIREKKENKKLKKENRKINIELTKCHKLLELNNIKFKKTEVQISLMDYFYETLKNLL